MLAVARFELAEVDDLAGLRGRRGRAWFHRENSTRSWWPGGEITRSGYGGPLAATSTVEPSAPRSSIARCPVTVAVPVLVRCGTLAVSARVRLALLRLPDSLLPSAPDIFTYLPHIRTHTSLGSLSWRRNAGVA